MTKETNDFNYEDAALTREHENSAMNNSNNLNTMKENNNETKMKRHEYSSLFPQADELTLKALADDISKNGLYEPIVTHEDKILDGWNRYLACQEANIVWRFEKYEGDDPLGYVLSKNASRRHLTTSQRALIAAKMMAEQSSLQSNPQICGLLCSQVKAAGMLGVSERQVQEAARLLREAPPELIAEVEESKQTIHAALKKIKPVKAKSKAGVLPHRATCPRSL